MSDETPQNTFDLRSWFRICAGLLLLPPALAFGAAIWPAWVPVPFVDPSLTEGSTTLLFVIGFGLLLVNGGFLAAAYYLLQQKD